MPVRKTWAMVSSQSCWSWASRSRTEPGWPSNSALAMMKRQPPGRASASQASQRENSSRTLGSPRGAARAGRTTRSMKRARVWSSSWSWSASLDWKWAKSPLLESSVAAASDPMVRPPSPTRLATRAASSSTACLVSVPLLMRQEKHERSSTSRGSHGGAFRALGGPGGEVVLQAFQDPAGDGVAFALDLDGGEGVGDGQVLDGGVGGGAEDDLAGLGDLLLEAGGEVDGVADGGEVAELVAADVADEGGPGVDPDPEPEPVGLALGDRLDGRLHAQGGPGRPQGVVGLAGRGVEQGHDRVADELDDRAPVGQQQRHGPAEVLVEHAHHLVGGGPLGVGREPAQVGEEHRHLGH